MAVTGKFEGPSATDFTGYRAMVFFQDETGNHRAADAASDKEGNFTFDLPVAVASDSEAKFQAQAPGGIIVGEKTVPAADLDQEISIEVTQAIPTRIEPVDLEVGKRMRVIGRILNQDGSSIPVGVPVMILGRAVAADVDRVLAVTTTRSDGYFGVDVIVERLAAASVKVGPLEPQPLTLENEHIPAHVIAVVSEPVSPAANTGDGTPRAPGHEDFEAASGLFSEDRGGGCVNFTTPNRTLEEVPFFAVVRTTQPNIKGFVVGPDTKEAHPDLVKALDARLGELDKLRSREIAVTSGSGLRRTTGAVRLTSDDAGFAIAEGPLGFANVGAERNIQDAFSSLVQPGLTDVRTISKAFASVHDFQGPDELAPVVQDVANTRILDLIKAATATEPGRVELDQFNRIDWDDTPTIYQATEIAHGHLLTFKQAWKADGYSLGDLLYSLPLAPGQKKLVSTLDWNRTEVAARVAERRVTESLSASLVRDRDISETISTALHESLRARSESTTAAVGGGIGAFIGPIVIGGGGGFSRAGSSANQISTRSVSGLSLQQIQDRTMQASSLVRSQRATVVQTARQGESLRAQTDVVANYNHCHALTIEYFEVLRHFQVTTELAHVQECLFVPFEISAFDGPKALRWKEELGRSLPTRYRPYLAALERRQTNWARADFPSARYADETLRHFDGEIQLRISLPRPDDNSDGTFNSANWLVYSVCLRAETQKIFGVLILLPSPRRDATRPGHNEWRP